MFYPDHMASDEDWLHAIGELPRENVATGEDHRRHLADALTASANPSAYSRDSSQS
jgi:hypothetical protein